MGGRSAIFSSRRGKGRRKKHTRAERASASSLLRSWPRIPASKIPLLDAPDRDAPDSVSRKKLGILPGNASEHRHISLSPPAGVIRPTAAAATSSDDASRDIRWKEVECQLARRMGDFTRPPPRQRPHACPFPYPFLCPCPFLPCGPFPPPWAPPWDDASWACSSRHRVRSRAQRRTSARP